jgi:UDP-N-acetylmuramoylalanine--D-glutamate ligase
VVLSPACSSYDMFQNFEHRGRVFREAVAAVGARRIGV